MWGTRRSLFLCAAGLASAGGCTSPFGPVEPGASTPIIRAQETARRDGEPAPPVAAPPVELTAGRGPLPRSTPSLAPGDTPLPINLATAFQLAGARPLDVQIAGRQVAAIALFLVGLFLIGSAYRVRRQR